MKTIKKIIPLSMSAVLLVSAVPTVSAAGVPSEKEEVIYINLTADGSTKDIYAVNIFGKGDITDYGDYTDVKLLNTTDKISQKGDLITFSTSSDRVYYQGTMKNTEIPWNISIKYFLDGKEYSSKEVAGKSGKLEIRFQVTKNESVEGSYFENYALQATFTLDTEKCSNIVADNATLANVGSSKQISYTMLPGEGIDTTITADVTDFEMEAVSINGVPLSLDIEVDDEELMNRVNELLDAIAELDDGAGELKDGVVELQDGVKNDLETGSEELADGARSLNSGVAVIQQGLGELNSKSKNLTDGSAEINKALLTIQKELSAVSASTEQIDALVRGSSRIKSGIDELSQGITNLQNNVSFEFYKASMKQNGLDIDQLQSANSQTISSLNQQIAALDQTISDLTAMGAGQEQILQLMAQREQLQGIATLLQGNSAAINGMDIYLTQIGNGIAELSAGVETLKVNYQVLDEGINTLASELKVLMVNMSSLKNGIDTLVTAYGKLDDGINGYTDGVASIIAGYTNLSTGAEELLNGTGELNQGVAELKDGIEKLSDGVAELKDGTAEMRSETEGMDTEISDKIDEMIESITGDGSEVVSFVSEKNTNVDSVQFVIQTEAIEIEDTVSTGADVEENLNFWQKLLRLFGLY